MRQILIVTALSFAALPGSIPANAKERSLPAMPSADLLTCGAEPETPPLPAQDWSSMGQAKRVQSERDKIVLGYIMALRTWGADCAGKMNELKSWRVREPSSQAKVK